MELNHKISSIKSREGRKGGENKKCNEKKTPLRITDFNPTI